MCVWGEGGEREDMKSNSDVEDLGENSKQFSIERYIFLLIYYSGCVEYLLFSIFLNVFEVGLLYLLS